ncbi:hypothetical protein QQ054_32225 [Oscillatoria amoena NRMC-F 0135]|nr:hypothetical protein [Oscillatoria amoena NRMC-F 0135]
MKNLIIVLLFIIVVGCKKEECKQCKTITLHFMQGQAEKYGNSTPTNNTVCYDTTYSTECSSGEIPYQTHVGWTKDSVIKKGALLQIPVKNWVCPADTVITFVYTGSRFCD